MSAPRFSCLSTTILVPAPCHAAGAGGRGRWARAQPTREEVEQQIAALPKHAQPPVRELGRRSEAAEHPFRRPWAAAQVEVAGGSGVVYHAPMALIGKVGRREEIVAACPAALALGVSVGMAATHARALVSHLDFRAAEPEVDARLLDRLALLLLRYKLGPGPPKLYPKST